MKRILDCQASDFKAMNREELLAAIGSDRIISLEPGEYELSGAEGFGTAAVKAGTGTPVMTVLNW